MDIEAVATVEVTVEAVLIRADGTRVDLGVVSETVAPDDAEDD